MSNPQPDHLEPRPRRANPIQPDRPAGADDTEPTPAPAADTGAAGRRKQEQDAVDNVREGYGRP